MNVNPIALKQDLELPWLMALALFCLEVVYQSTYAVWTTRRFARTVLGVATVTTLLNSAVFLKYASELVAWSVPLFLLLLLLLLGWSLLLFRYWMYYRRADPFSWSMGDKELARSLKKLLLLNTSGTAIALLVMIIWWPASR
jgi:hypothetical protein